MRRASFSGCGTCPRDAGSSSPSRGLNPLQGELTAGPPGESLDHLLKSAAALCLGLVVEVGLPFSPGFRGGFGVRPPLFSATTFSSAPKDEHRDHPPCADFAVDATAQHLGIPEPCRLLTPHSEVPSILQDGAQEPCCSPRPRPQPGPPWPLLLQSPPRPSWPCSGETVSPVQGLRGARSEPSTTPLPAPHAFLGPQRTPAQ